MVAPNLYEIEYSPAALEHLRELTRREQQIVLDTVDEQLKHQPDVQTRNRKRLRPNLLADWELRIGTLRVYYFVQPRLVSIVAVGKKRGNRVFIGGIEVML
jgi:mRNA-degrading endonuclease RelE of RelBE toxin-antitoxin system